MITTIPDTINYYDHEISGIDGLFLCVWRNDIFPAKSLLEEGVDVNGRYVDGSTALHACTLFKCDNHEMAHFLVKNGADVNALDNNKRTPLHFLAFKGMDNITLVKLLLSKNANPYLKDRWNESALDIAIREENKEFISVVQDHYDLKNIEKSMIQNIDNISKAWNKIKRGFNHDYERA